MTIPISDRIGIRISTYVIKRLPNGKYEVRSSDKPNEAFLGDTAAEAVGTLELVRMNCDPTTGLQRDGNAA